MKKSLTCDEIPKLAKEWHPTKNGNIRPQNVKSGSNMKIWWMCSKGHEWTAMVYHRTRNKSGCPYCSGRYAIPNENDLQTLKPEIAKEWHPTKNNELEPINFKPGSNVKVWWMCKEGHEWQATIVDRTKVNGSNCPYCSGNLNIIGKTDLQTFKPEIAKEWHPIKNGDLKPENFAKYSGKKVWWLCENNHEWNATIISRTRMNAGCPYCVGTKPIKGKTDLATCASELVKEWHPTKNGKLKASDVTVSSGRKVWWICEKGHEWQAVISTRTGKDKCGCPYCYGRYAIPGETDLVTLNPELAKEWHPTKNKLLSCCEVKISSNKKVWWLCENNHEWKAAISSRSYGDGCPYCYKEKLLRR